MAFATARSLLPSLLYSLSCCCELSINIFCKSGPVRIGLVSLQWWLQILVALNLSALCLLMPCVHHRWAGGFAPSLGCHPHLGWQSSCYFASYQIERRTMAKHALTSEASSWRQQDHCCSPFSGQCKSLPGARKVQSYHRPQKEKPEYLGRALMMTTKE